jgi:hypothetical protein
MLTSVLSGHRAEQHGADFYPVVLDCFGRLGAGALSFIEKLKEEIVNLGLNYFEDQTIRSYLRRSMSFALMKGNGAILLQGSRQARVRV